MVALSLDAPPPFTANTQPVKANGADTGAEPTPVDVAGAHMPNSILWDFDEDGVPVWKDKDESSSLTSRFQRVWQEKGDFSQLTTQSIMRDAVVKETQDAVEPAKSEKVDDTISVDQMRTMRQTIWEHLGRIQEDLTSGLDLLNVMLAPLDPSTVQADTLPLPPGSIAPSVLSSSHLPNPLESATLRDSAISLLVKQQATKDAASVLAGAGKEIAERLDRSGEEWERLIQLREKGWIMRPKGARPGQGTNLVGRGQDRVARDVGIAFAATEAAKALRTSSLASLTPSTSALISKPTLVLPPRPRRRLAVVYTDNAGTEHNFSPPHNDSVVSRSLDGDLAHARAEVFDEEIFGEVAREARGMIGRSTIVSDDSVTVDGLETGGRLRFEMSEDSTTTAPSSPLANLISASLRLLLITVYRRRRLLPSSHPAHPGVHREAAQPTILRPTLELLLFYISVTALQERLSSAAQGLMNAGVDAEVMFDPVFQDAEKIVEGFTQGKEGGLNLGGTVELRIAARHSVAFAVSSPCNIAVNLDQGPLATSAHRLEDILGIEIRRRLLEEIALLVRHQHAGWVQRMIIDHLSIHKGGWAIRFSPSFAGNCLVIVAELVAQGRTPATERNVFEGEATLADWLSGLLVTAD